ncbi:hypothetical protein [Psychroflexus salis]|uniref:Uncharacterized protein n=1 Tax=Psychroflexus salis TaxID=1526574 RepID=A0A916ZVL1_9FLAO|nr:hypothetical protein [Psychroflexus salis]GGE15880.1 hypothetical protein GCM10010831_16470 [Psychroflexus salis]
MKLFATYSLIALFTFQSFGINAIGLVNLSNLISHYQHHKIEHQDSFLEFLDLHYGSQKEAHSDEHDEHENLPFQDVISLVSNLYFTTPVSVQLLPIQITISSTKNFEYQDYFSTLHPAEILQPPKFLIETKI